MQHPALFRSTPVLVYILASLTAACWVDDGGTHPLPAVGSGPPSPERGRPTQRDASAGGTNNADADGPSMPDPDPVAPSDAAADLPEPAAAVDAAEPPSSGAADASVDTAAADTSAAAGNPACDKPLAMPARSRRLGGPRGDDFAFAPSGHLIGFDGRNVVQSARQGPLEVLVANVMGQRGGALRALPTGQLFIADFERAAVSVREPDGQLRRLPTRIDDPMKMVLGPGRSLYVSNKGGTITRIDAGTGAAAVVGRARFEIGGLTFSRDYKLLLVGALDVDGVHAFDVNADGSLGPPSLWRRQIARAQALTTDECNNVYFISETDGRIRRVTPRMTVETVAELAAQNLWALAFGSGQQGWSRTALYAEEANSGGLHEIELGVAGQPAP